ncbi:hypothetical protein OG330_31135 (plasmid) [Streptomyces albidoflavus]|uniref:hypothetical protein n=1 Tax=Streptomyces TaxID=1883 RepID=UPI00101E6EAF|nr:MULTISPECIES: hypothetical protein [Streptomyces]WSU19558.1 hypothetical protein OG330_31135 [Streptomyces albidoflavus]
MSEPTTSRRRRKKLGISTRGPGGGAAPAESPGAEGSNPPTGEHGSGAALEPLPASGPQPTGQNEGGLLDNFGGGLPAVTDLFAPQLVDRSQLPDAPEDRLAVYENAIEASRGALADTVTRARFRAEIEIGFVLDAIRSEPDLYTQKYGTIENYGSTRWGYKRSTMYELMDTAPIRLAAASGRAVSGNPDTKGHTALGPPAPRPALEAATDSPEGLTSERAQPVKWVKAELSKSVALELVTAWRSQGENQALSMLAEADERAKAEGRKLTAALVRKVVKDSGQAPSDKSGLRPSEAEQREAVNHTLSSAVATLNRIIADLDKLDMENVPPLRHDQAERDAKAIRVAGRWLNNRVQVPQVVDAELVGE